MQSFAGTMQTLINEINTAQDERTVAIRLVAEEVCNFRNDVNTFMMEIQDFVHDGLQLRTMEHAQATRKKLSFDEKARVETARMFMDDTRTNLKKFFDMSRTGRELEVKDQLETIRLELADARTNLAAGKKVWAERKSNGNGKHPHKAAEIVARPVKKEAKQTRKKTARK
jgi:hypothetical protein